MGMYDGSPGDFYSYIRNNLSYPLMAKRYGSQGVAIASFMIDREGRSTREYVVNEIGNGCGDEVVRLIKNAQWKPDSTNNTYELPLRFQLEDFNTVLELAYSKASGFYEQKNYSEVIPYLNTIVALNPYDVAAIKRRCIAYYNTQQIGLACRDNARLAELGQTIVDDIDCK